jgi:hypothetical protein
VAVVGAGVAFDEALAFEAVQDGARVGALQAPVAAAMQPGEGRVGLQVARDHAL